MHINVFNLELVKYVTFYSHLCVLYRNIKNASYSTHLGFYLERWKYATRYAHLGFFYSEKSNSDAFYTHYTFYLGILNMLIFISI